MYSYRCVEELRVFFIFHIFFFLYVPLSCHRISDTNYVGFSFPPVVCSTQSTSTPSRPYAKRTRRANRIFLVPPLIRCYLDVAPLLNEVVDFNTILYICFFPFLSPFSLPTSTLFLSLFSVISSAARSFQNRCGSRLIGAFVLLKCFQFRVRVFTVGERLLLGSATIALGKSHPIVSPAACRLRRPAYYFVRHRVYVFFSFFT